MRILELRVLKWTFFTIFLVVAKFEIAHAEDFKLGLLHGDEDVFSYEISVLKLALSQAEGEHTLKIVPYPNSSQERIIQTLKSRPDTVNVFFTANTPSRNKTLLRINVPLTRGLLGHRVLVVKKSRLTEFEHMDSLSQLQTLTLGSGLGWAENEILQSSNFKIATATYKNLWPMLVAERFDAFHRGIQEFAIELEHRKDLNLTTIPGVMLTFPLDYFFFVSRDNQKLHDILLQGLERAYENGTFMENFINHPSIRLAFDYGNIMTRKAIQIDNILFDDQAKLIPPHYWHTPVVATIK